jgi:methylthioribose-1-phosphate isomerase
MSDETRTVFWEDGRVCMIDQRHIPLAFEIVRYDTVQQVADAIRTMVVRGAPAIGAAAAFGLALAAHRSAASTVEGLVGDLHAARGVLAASRPTAVNLFWALDRCMTVAKGGAWHSTEPLRDAMLAEAQAIADEDIATNRRIGMHGAMLVPDGATIIHHCNTGSLATVGWGTALGVIRSAALVQGKRIHVLVDETRPRLQGARLTAWELVQAGIPHKIIADGASGHYMRRHGVDLCLVGADRIAANGDVANKIGTYNLAVLAKENGVPFYSVAPWSTVDMSILHGDLIEIEERDADEVKVIQGQPIAPPESPAGNPAFDVTPNHYLSGIITEYGVIRPPFSVALARLAAEIARGA